MFFKKIRQVGRQRGKQVGKGPPKSSSKTLGSRGAGLGKMLNRPKIVNAVSTESIVMIFVSCLPIARLFLH